MISKLAFCFETTFCTFCYAYENVINFKVILKILLIKSYQLAELLCIIWKASLLSNFLGTTMEILTNVLVQSKKTRLGLYQIVVHCSNSDEYVEVPCL